LNPHYSAVAKRANGRCEYCHAPEQVFNFAFEVEHILPRSRGGSEAWDNLALACESCNLYKGSAVQGYDPDQAQDAPLFHPRHETWDKHFRFDGETGLIVGLTAMGRATVDRLKFNSDFQHRARRHWARIGLFPGH
jgi:hypothetical protein